VLDGLRYHLLDPELFREFCAEFTRELNRQRGDQTGRRERLAAELRQIERRLRRIVDAITGGLPARTLKDELLALEHQQDQVKAELAAVPEAEQTRLHPNLAEIYRTKVAELHRALEDPPIRDEALHILRGLLERIVITPAAGPGETIELVGAIARMVELGNKKAALDARTACSVKVVAGAHNHRQFALPPIPV
jgi:site-specific DNA recombinase